MKLTACPSIYDLTTKSNGQLPCFIIHQIVTAVVFIQVLKSFLFNPNRVNVFSAVPGFFNGALVIYPF